MERTGPSEPVVEPTSDALPGLTPDEDDELRRLGWISQVGSLAWHKQERMMQLRARDRRREIRPPREFGEDEQRAAPFKAGRRFLLRRNR